MKTTHLKEPWLIVGGALVLVVGLLYLGHGIYKATETSAFNEFNRRQLVMAEAARNGLELYFETLAQDMKALSVIPEIQQLEEVATRREIRRRFEELSPRGVNDVGVLDAEGVVRYSVTAPQLEGQDFSWRTYFQRTRQIGPGDDYTVEFIELKGADAGEKGVILAFPMFRQSVDSASSSPPKFAGVIVSTFYQVSILGRFIEPIKGSENGYAFLFDVESNALWAQGRSTSGAEFFDEAHESSECRQLVQAMRAGESHSTQCRRGQLGGLANDQDSKDEEVYLASFGPVRVGDQLWAVGVAAPARDARALIRSAYYRQLALLGAAVLIVLASAGYILTVSLRNHRLLEKRVESKTRELQEAGNIFQSVIDGLPEAIMVLDLDYNIALANRTVREMAGRDPVADGLTCHQVSHHRETPCDDVAHPCPLQQVVETKMPVTVIHTHFDAEENELIVENVAAPIFDARGEVVQVIESCRDVTERVRAEEEALQQHERMVQIDKMASLGILVSGVAHEVNNPNQYVMSNLGLLAEAWHSVEPILEDYYKENGDFLIGDLSYLDMREQIREMFGEVQAGCQRIKHIVDELREFARERPAELTESVDLNAVVQSAISLLSNMIGKSTDRFSVRYGKALPRVTGDFRRLEQVVINLVQNACQALEDRGQAIIVTTSLREDGNKVTLEVSDEGVGISKKALNHIMDPFYTTRRDSGGTGLGLSIASSIVDEHEGTLELRSAPAEGTTAMVALPVSTSARSQAPDAAGPTVDSAVG